MLCGTAGPVFWITVAAAMTSVLPRWIAAFRFGQSKLGALLHPVGVLLLLAIQWQAFLRWRLRLPSSWKGRNYGPEKAPPVKGIRPAHLNS
jgi:hypothetical protein